MTCYEEHFNKGIIKYDSDDFLDAKKEFRAAGVCDDIDVSNKKKADEWINRCDSAYIEALKHANELTKTALESAKRASLSDSIAREIAEQESKISEANRIAFIANQKLSQDSTTVALKLAHFAYELIIDIPTELVKNTFGNASYHNTKLMLADDTLFVKSADFSSDGKKILMVTDNSPLKILNTDGSTYKVLSSWKKVKAPRFAPNSTQVLGILEDSTINIWNLVKGSPTALIGHQKLISGFTFSPLNNNVLTWSRDETAQVWDDQGKSIFHLGNHEASIVECNFSPNGTKVLLRLANKKVRIWDLEARQVRESIAHNKYIYSASFSPDGKFILTSSADQTARIWDNNGYQLAVLRGHDDLVHLSTFSPDGQKILTASTDHTAKIWNLGGELLHNLTGHQDWVTHALFSEDGQKVITASKDHRILIWDVDGKLKISLKHNGPIIDVNYNQKIDAFLTVAKDGSIKLWDHNGMELLEHREIGCQPLSAKFSPDGHYILTIWDNGKAFLAQTPQFVLERLEKEPLPLSKYQMELYDIAINKFEK